MSKCSDFFEVVLPASCLSPDQLEDSFGYFAGGLLYACGPGGSVLVESGIGEYIPPFEDWRGTLLLQPFEVKVLQSIPGVQIARKEG